MQPKSSTIACSSSGPGLALRARSITSCSRVGSQSATPVSCFDWPTLTARLARLLSRPSSSSSIASISDRRSSMVICSAPLLECFRSHSPVSTELHYTFGLANALGAINEIKRPAATRKVAAGFEIFLRVYFSRLPGDAHKLSRSRSP